MRWIRFTRDATTAYGILEGDRITEVTGSPFASYERTQRRHDLRDVKIEVPVIPGTFYAAGLNYTAHLRPGVKPPEKADIGYRANNALIAHGESVVIPRDATPQVHFEGELVVVIGRKAKYLTEADALSCVFGYTIGNDVSDRGWQKSDRTIWRGKNTDTWKPMGPWIETDVDLDRMETIIRLNEKETGRFTTNNMLFGIAKFISVMTRYLTLHPGDVIWMGTDGESPNLKPGDVVDVEITGIGHLRNPFVGEPA
jgi:2-keto-4-pentenoate hydratase/2-oxohepta-3-ene-1,7-dioic acid hydratase in catechol pathway